MADLYKILGQGATGNSEYLLYQVPTSTNTSLSCIRITNTSNSSKTYKLSFIPAIENNISSSYYRHYVVYDKVILSNTTEEINGGITLSEGDQIRAYSDSDEVAFNVYGVEIS